MLVLDIGYPLSARLGFCTFRYIVSELDFGAAVETVIGLLKKVVFRIRVWWW